MGPKMRASAILDGRTCHSRIEQAVAQGQLFAPEQQKQEQRSLLEGTHDLPPNHMPPRPQKPDIIGTVNIPAD